MGAIADRPSDVDTALWLKQRAHDAGFDACRIAPARLDRAGARLAQWLREGHHGTMDWMAARAAARASPDALWPAARSAIVVGLNYAPEENPLAALARRSDGLVSVYARGRDYHDVIKGRLKQIAGAFAARTGAAVKVFVDTAPLLEKPLAARAGLGWQGKHTVLISRALGNWLFLGVILTDMDLPADTPETDHCGTCRRCLDICPTQAFPAPYVLDSRRCISYLTIEHKGPIPRAFRVPIGNRVFGCDDCLAVCPWNKFASEARERLLASAGRPTRLADLLALDDAAFRRVFAGSPVKRTGRDRFLRNVLIAAGNSADDSLVAPVRAHLDDPSMLVRGMAVWALSRLLPGPVFAALRAERRPGETDSQVIAEWDGADGMESDPLETGETGNDP
jgi:epoxyqueuosine reductase